MTRPKCFACDKAFRSAARWTVQTIDRAQWVDVGPDCYKKVEAAGPEGYQPPLGGPRLITIPMEDLGKNPNRS